MSDQQTDTVSTLLDALDDVFEEERDILLNGRIQSLPEVLHRKSDLVERLKACAPQDPLPVQHLRQKAEQNQSLMLSASQGLRQVLDRLNDLEQLRHSFDIYDARGHRCAIEGQVVRHVEKRA